MKAAYALLLALTSLPSLAHADAYDDRLAANEARATQNSVAKIEAQYAKAQAVNLEDIARFAHRYALAETPNCSTRDSNEKSLWNRNRQECGSGLCVNVHGPVYGRSKYGNSADAAQIYLGSMMITGCKVMLKNGLACEISYNFENGTYGGNCLDANGASKTLGVPSVEGKISIN
jgi:hypothetical protein